MAKKMLIPFLKATEHVLINFAEDFIVFFAKVLLTLGKQGFSFSFRRLFIQEKEGMIFSPSFKESKSFLQEKIK